MKKIVALSLTDIKIALRRSEGLIITLIVPAAVLIAYAIFADNTSKVVPFIYVQVVMGVSLLSLGITTGFDRRYRVLVRLGTTPLGRRGLVFSKILTMAVVQSVQLAVMTVIALAVGFRPHIGWFLALPTCWLSSAAFAGIALLIAGRLRAEANLGVQNLMYLVLIGCAGIGFDTAPSRTLENFAHLTPSGALHSLLRAQQGLEHFSPLALTAIIVEAVILPLLAARHFRFDES
jgi:ABC-2 type transport system permease protein